MGLVAPRRYLIKPPCDVGQQQTRAFADIAALWAFTEGGGAPIYLPSNAPGTLSGTGVPTWVIGDTGPALNFTGNPLNSCYVDYGADPFLKDLALDGNPGATWLWRFQVAVSGGLACRTDAVMTGWNIGIGGGGGMTVRFPRNGGAMIGNGNNALINVGGGQWYNLAVGYDCKNLTTSLTSAVNGVFDTAVVNAPGGGTSVSDSGDNFQIGQIKNGSGEAQFAIDGNISLMAVWKRVLSPVEMVEVTLDENIVFQSIRNSRLSTLAGLRTVRPLIYAVT